MPNMKVLSLFTGAGGLDLGLEAAGFEIAGCVEIDEDSRRTLRQNRPGWRLAEPGNIHAYEPEQLLSVLGLDRGSVAVLSAGPPCQPFSKSGYWVNGDSRRLEDPRARTLSAYLAVVEVALPEVLLLENVEGLSFRGKDEGLKLLEEELKRINARHGTSYRPQMMRINAANYGVPQTRERVFLLAERGGGAFRPLPPTHSESNGDKSYRGPMSHTTAWDAIGHLDVEHWDQSLAMQGKWRDLLSSIPEGQNYQWHTLRGGGEPLFGWRTRYWSFLLKLAKSRPSWTLQAQPGPATGPFHWH